MFIGKVCGAVVATQKEQRMAETKLLLIEACTVAVDGTPTIKPTGRVLTAVDSLGAGTGAYVLVTQGSSARLTEATKSMPVDAVVIGVIDSIAVQDQVLSRSDGTLPG